MKEYEQRATKIIMNTVEGVKAQIRKAYNKGYADGQKEKPQAIYEMKVEEYNKGLNKAWECARKMCLMSPEERLRAFDVSGNHLAILSDLTAPKAIEKLKAFEQKQKCKECKKTKDPIFYGHCVGECDYAKQTEDEIKVGDEVYSDDFDDNGIVSHITEDGNCVAIISSGSSMMKVNIHNVYKTGRHFPQIAEVLAELRGAE